MNREGGATSRGVRPAPATTRQVVGALILLATWWFLSDDVLGVLPSAAIAAPSETASRTVELVSSGEFWKDVRDTIGRALAGVVLAFLLGFPIGVLLGCSRTLAELTDFPVDFLRSIPVTALYPVFVLTLGIGTKPATAMVVAACIFPILINTLQGARSAETLRRDLARVYGAGRLQVFVDVTCYEVLPYAIAGIRLALSISLIVVVLAEMFLGINAGVGQLLWDAFSRNDARTITAALITVGLIGFLMNRAFQLAARKTFSWVEV